MTQISKWRPWIAVGACFVGVIVFFFEWDRRNYPFPVPKIIPYHQWLEAGELKKLYWKTHEESFAVAQEIWRKKSNVSNVELLSNWNSPNQHVKPRF